MKVDPERDFVRVGEDFFIPPSLFRRPGGQVLRLVGIDEDLSFYEGAGEGPNVAKVKEALKRRHGDWPKISQWSHSAQACFRVSPDVWTKRMVGTSRRGARIRCGMSKALPRLLAMLGIGRGPFA
jgi:hypothetical protein